MVKKRYPLAMLLVYAAFVYVLFFMPEVWQGKYFKVDRISGECVTVSTKENTLINKDWTCPKLFNGIKIAWCVITNDEGFRDVRRGGEVVNYRERAYYDVEYVACPWRA